MSKRTFHFFIFTLSLLAAAVTHCPAPAAAHEVTPMVAFGNGHTIILKADGTVWSWGSGGSGQMGNGTTQDYTQPYLTPVQANISDVKYIAGGNSNTYAIKKDGTLWAWGFNGSGELGVGDKIDRNVPTQVLGVENVVQVAGTNGGFAACVTADGKVYAWGANNITINRVFYGGQLGNGSTVSSTTPVQATAVGFEDIREISVGAGHVVARKGDGTVWTWGINRYKQCGRGAQTYYTSPGQVTANGIENITKVKAGSNHTVVRKSDGRVWTWGWNKYGQLGQGYKLLYEVSPGVFGGDYSTEASYNPAVIEELIDIIDIAAGYNQTMVKKSDGTIMSVGMNYRGELGDGQALLVAPFATELFVEPLITGATMQIDTFAGNTGFLKTDGTIWICGANSQNQVGTGGTSLYIDVPTLAGYALERHELALETFGEGTVERTPDLPFYTEGTSVTLTALPGDGWGFAEWTPGYDRTNPLVFQIPASQPITAYFIRIGDVNWDDVINLADALAVLQIIAGDTNTFAHPGAVKSSSKIGIADAVYILQKTAELR